MILETRHQYHQDFLSQTWRGLPRSFRGSLSPAVREGPGPAAPFRHSWPHCHGAHVGGGSIPCETSPKQINHCNHTQQSRRRTCRRQGHTRNQTRKRWAGGGAHCHKGPAWGKSATTCRKDSPTVTPRQRGMAPNCTKMAQKWP